MNSTSNRRTELGGIMHDPASPNSMSNQQKSTQIIVITTITMIIGFFFFSFRNLQSLELHWVNSALIL